MLFKGNLRGDPAAAYQKLTARLKVQHLPLLAATLLLLLLLLCLGCWHWRLWLARPAQAKPRLSPKLPVLQEQLGEQYKLYLLEDQEERPVAVLLPADAVQTRVSPAAEAGLAALFGACTLATTLNIK